MRLLHYSPKPLVLRECSYLQAHDTGAPGKPNGLWVSVEGEDDWLDWCSGEMPEWVNGRAITEIVLHDDAKVLKIESDAQLLAFHHRFGAVPDYELQRYPRDMWAKQPHWRSVAETYAGIIIAPYNWARRLDRETQWYYTWDCASGCIWNLDAIKECKEAGYHGEVVA